MNMILTASAPLRNIIYVQLHHFTCLFNNIGLFSIQLIYLETSI